MRSLPEGVSAELVLGCCGDQGEQIQQRWFVEPTTSFIDVGDPLLDPVFVGGDRVGESKQVHDSITDGVATTDSIKVFHEVPGREVGVGNVPGACLLVAARQQVQGGVLADEEGGRVDPLAAAFPPLDGGRVEETLSHEPARLVEFAEVSRRCMERPDALDDQLRRALDARSMVLLVVEMLGEEQLAEHGLEFPLALDKGVRHLPKHALLGLGEPAGSIVDEVAVEFFADEPRGRWTREDQFDEVVAVPVATAAEDPLAALVVVPSVELELVVAKRVSSEGACPLLDVVLGIAPALAEGEEFHQFPGKVLVRTVAVVLVVVEVLDHRRVSDDALHEVILEVAGPVFPEELVLEEHVVTVLDRSIAGGEVAVPEQCQFFLQRSGGLDHPLQPPVLDRRHLAPVGTLAHPGAWCAAAPGRPRCPIAGPVGVRGVPPRCGGCMMDESNRSARTGSSLTFWNSSR